MPPPASLLGILIRTHAEAKTEFAGSPLIALLATCSLCVAALAVGALVRTRRIMARSLEIQREHQADAPAGDAAARGAVERAPLMLDEGSTVDEPVRTARIVRVERPEAA